MLTRRPYHAMPSIALQYAVDIINHGIWVEKVSAVSKCAVGQERQQRKQDMRGGPTYIHDSRRPARSRSPIFGIALAM